MSPVFGQGFSVTHLNYNLFHEVFGALNRAAAVVVE